MSGQQVQLVEQVIPLSLLQEGELAHISPIAKIFEQFRILLKFESLEQLEDRQLRDFWARRPHPALQY